MNSSTWALLASGLVPSMKGYASANHRNGICNIGAALGGEEALDTGDTLDTGDAPEIEATADMGATFETKLGTTMIDTGDALDTTAGEAGSAAGSGMPVAVVPQSQDC